MALPVIADIFRVAWKYHSQSGLSAPVNVMHFRAPSSDANDVWTALDAHQTSAMLGQTGDYCGVTEVDVTPLDGSSLTSLNTTGLPSKWKGPSSAVDPVPQVAALLKITTNVRGRSYRGRLYLPWCREDVIATGVLSSSVVASMNTAWATWFAAMASDGVFLSVASYTLSVATDANIPTVESFTATQRRRQPRK